MKVALVHDYIKEYGGAERVLETLHEIFPDAPIFTAVYLPGYSGPHKERVKKWNIKPSILQHIPFKGKLLSAFRLVAPFIFSRMDFSDYDVVIVSAAGTYTGINWIKTGPKTVHICYYHTPPRYLYGYPTAAAWDEIKWRKILKFFGQVPMHFLRMVDFNSAQKPDFILCNSQEVAGRIRKFYHREATVIFPPVDIPSNGKAGDKNNKTFYLAGGRLARHKRQDLAVKACTKLNLPLKVFGGTFASYGQKELAKFAGPKVEFLGEVDDETKWNLYRKAKALIFPSEHEDFGIMPVEAMAVGTPVIAYRSGGVKETVIEGKTGIFFDEPTTESLVGAIKKFERMRISPEDCINQAKKFSKERFKKEIKEFVEEVT